MKCSCTGDRTDKAGKHLDRNFNLGRADHINPELCQYNKYWTWNGNTDQTFEQCEIEFYEEHFRQYLDAQNEKHIQHGNYDRVRSMNDYHKGLHTRPEGKILEIGNRNEHPDPEILWECALQFKDDIEAMYEGKVRILDMALHLDEPDAGPHVHFRQVWIAEKNGMERENQTEALTQLGIHAPNPNEEINRTNNAKMSYSAAEKSRWEYICMERVPCIERRTPGNRGRKATATLKIETAEKQAIELELQNKERAAENSRLEAMTNQLILLNQKLKREQEEMELHNKELEALNKELQEKIDNKSSHEAFKDTIARKKLEVDYIQAITYIKDKGLEKDFAKHCGKSVKNIEQEIENIKDGINDTNNR